MAIHGAVTLGSPPTPTWVAQQAVDKTIDLTMGLVRDSLIYQSHLYAFFTVAMFPIWMMFWTIVHHRSGP
jgi:hypothetical protein